MKPKKLPKYPQNLKMTKIPPQTPKKTKIPTKFKKYQISLNLKMTKIPSEPKNDQNTTKT